MRSSAYHYATYLLFLTFLIEVNAEKRNNKILEIEETTKQNTKTKKLGSQKIIKHNHIEDDDELSNEHLGLINEVDTISRKQPTDRRHNNVADNEYSSEEMINTPSIKQTKKQENINKNNNKKDQTNPNKNKVETSASANNGKYNCKTAASKTKFGNKICDIDSDGSNEADSEESREDEDARPRKKIKYSIKFAHEKERSKKKKQAVDSTIMRIHKNGKKKNRYVDDDDSSEEHDEPFPKKFRFYEDDDDF